MQRRIESRRMIQSQCGHANVRSRAQSSESRPRPPSRSLRVDSLLHARAYASTRAAFETPFENRLQGFTPGSSVVRRAGRFRTVQFIAVRVSGHNALVNEGEHLKKESYLKSGPIVGSMWAQWGGSPASVRVGNSRCTFRAPCKAGVPHGHSHARAQPPSVPFCGASSILYLRRVARAGGSALAERRASRRQRRPQRSPSQRDVHRYASRVGGRRAAAEKHIAADVGASASTALREPG